MTKTVVITGSTSGIGLGMAQAFIARGCNVVVSGRQQARVDAALAQIVGQEDQGRVLGCPCDVSIFDQVQCLWDSAAARFGQVDIWINNAGTINAQVPFVSLVPDDITAIVDTNLRGTLYGSWVALQGMLRQGFGQLYNMEGFGSDGSKRPGMTVYGGSKSAVRYVTRSLAKELKHAPIQICTLSPGIVVTDLLIRAYQTGVPENRRWAEVVFGVMADDCTTVSAWLVEQIARNKRSGRHITWLTFPRIVHHIVRAVVHRRTIFTADSS